MNLQKGKLATLSQTNEILWVIVSEYAKRGKFYITIHEKKDVQKRSAQRNFSVPLATNAARLLIALGYPPERRVAMLFPSSAQKPVESTIGKLARLPQLKPPAPGEKHHHAGESKAIAELVQYRQRQQARRARENQLPPERAASPANDNACLAGKNKKSSVISRQRS